MTNCRRPYLIFSYRLELLIILKSERLPLKTNMKREKKRFTKSARGIKTRFWPRRRENALDLSIPNAQKKSSSVIGDGKICLWGDMISSSTFRNSFCTYSFTLNVVLKSWVPGKGSSIEFNNKWQDKRDSADQILTSIIIKATWRSYTLLKET